MATGQILQCYYNVKRLNFIKIAGKEDAFQA